MTYTTETQHTGSIRLESRLFRFIIARENLDPRQPVLDLTRGTLICRELRHLLKKGSEVGKMPAVLSRPCVLRFSHHSDDWDKRRIHIDAGATNHFNDFIRDLIAEFAYAHIMNFVRFNDDEAKAGIIDFLETHYLDAHDLVASDFEYLEAIKKADYRLRTLRQSAFFYPSVNNRKRQSPKITAAEIRAMHDLSCEL